MSRGWDESLRQGYQAMKGEKSPSLTERKDLKSGRSGWEGATKGTGKRVASKLGSAR